MVPTELLAVQHYEHFLKLLENLEEVDCKPSVALLTGSTPSKQSRLIRMVKYILNGIFFPSTFVASCFSSFEI